MLFPYQLQQSAPADAARGESRGHTHVLPGCGSLFQRWAARSSGRYMLAAWPFTEKPGTLCWKFSLLPSLFRLQFPLHRASHSPTVSFLPRNRRGAL